MKYIKKIYLSVEGNELLPFDAYQTDTLSGSRANAIALRAYAELIDKEWAVGNIFAVHNNLKMVWLEDSNRVPVGGIIYDIRREINTGWIVLSFTDPAWRGIGLNRRVQELVESLMIEEGMSFIASHIHKDNTARRSAAEKMGMVGEYLRYEKQLVTL